MLAWRMRDAYEALAGELGIAVALETFEVALAIGGAHSKSIEERYRLYRGPSTSPSSAIHIHAPRAKQPCRKR